MRSRSTFSDQFNEGAWDSFSIEEFARSARTTLSNRRFWRIQWAIPAILLAHVLFDYLDNHSPVHVAGFAINALLIVPVIVASSEFEVVGALATALGGSLVLLSSSFFEPHTIHEATAEWLILGIVVLTALIIGWRDNRSRSQQELFEFATQSGEIAVWEYDAVHDLMRRSANHDGL